MFSLLSKGLLPLLGAIIGVSLYSKYGFPGGLVQTIPIFLVSSIALFLAYKTVFLHPDIARVCNEIWGLIVLGVVSVSTQLLLYIALNTSKYFEFTSTNSKVMVGAVVAAATSYISVVLLDDIKSEKSMLTAAGQCRRLFSSFSKHYDLKGDTLVMSACHYDKDSSVDGWGYSSRRKRADILCNYLKERRKSDT